jgi:hypothetical protein
MDINSLTPHYFEWAVKHMADMAIRLAKEPRPQARETHWSAMLAGRGQNGANASEPGAKRERATAKVGASRKQVDGSA